MTLIIVRHGETDFNVSGRYAGSTDVPLNDKGIEQALQLAQKLRLRQVDVIISSPLLRALKTAEIINGIHGVPLFTDERFSERCMGAFEGLTRLEAKERYPDVWVRNITRMPDERAPGGETIRQVDQRVFDGLCRLEAEYAGRCVLLVSHAFAARAMNRRLCRLSFADMHDFVLGNCEIAEYSIEPAGSVKNR